MEGTGRLVASIVAAGAALLLSVPVAGAAMRFASPSGVGMNPCTQAMPCNIATAIMGSSGDDVTIEPGTYNISHFLVDGGVTETIHGQSGAPRPVIVSSDIVGIELGGPSSSLSDVEVDTTAAGATGLEINGNGHVNVDSVISHAFASNTVACGEFAALTMTNSLCVADGSNSTGFLFQPSSGAPSSTLRNDTLEAPGGGTSAALWAYALSSAIATVTLSNSVAHGTAVDLRAQTDSSSTANIQADHSNYATDTQIGTGASVTRHGTGTNQTAAPLFANAGQDDFHELAGSPTIAAGLNSPANGMFDLDGNPRQVGGGTDIGAYQFIPAPTCQPLAASMAFGTATTVQLQCADGVGAPLTYAIVANPAHGSVSLNAATGAATYTPTSGYSGPDGFSFHATSSHGTSAPVGATLTVGAATAAPGGGKSRSPSDSQPVFSRTTFVALSSGPSVFVAAAKGTTISYTDTEAATTTFVVRKSAGKGVLSRGKCVKAPRKRKSKAKSCARYAVVGSFSHADSAGANRFGFSGRVNGRKLKPGRYQLLSAPRNSAGLRGATHTNAFAIVK